MLPRDKGGVVDPTLKVYGTKNVRVVDLSILPLEVAANTQCTSTSLVLVMVVLKARASILRRTVDQGDDIDGTSFVIV